MFKVSTNSLSVVDKDGRSFAILDNVLRPLNRRLRGVLFVEPKEAEKAGEEIVILAFWPPPQSRVILSSTFDSQLRLCPVLDLTQISSPPVPCFDSLGQMGECARVRLGDGIEPCVCCNIKPSSSCSQACPC